MNGVEHIKKFPFFQRHDHAPYKPTFVDQLTELAVQLAPCCVCSVSGFLSRRSGHASPYLISSGGRSWKNWVSLVLSSVLRWYAPLLFQFIGRRRMRCHCPLIMLTRELGGR